jgi:hypothetical protein
MGPARPGENFSTIIRLDQLMATEIVMWRQIFTFINFFSESTRVAARAHLDN